MNYYQLDSTTKQQRKHRYIAKQLRDEHPQLFNGLFNKSNDYYDEYL